MRTARNRGIAQIVDTAIHSAKFCAPRSTSTLIARPSLITRIENGGKVVLLLAPPGSGKSTLLAQWFAAAGTGARIAWLLCERADRDPVHFFACLAATISKATDQAAAPLDGNYSGRASARIHCSAGHLADALRDQLSVIDAELTVVIDDLQCLDSAESERMLLSLMMQSSPRVRWIVATRHVPRFDLQRLRLDDQLTLIGSAELSFEPEQVRSLARLLEGAELSLSQATEYCRRTEGWIAGVKLSLLSAGRAEQADGLNHDIAAYLAAVAWDDVPATLREFALASCVAERICSEQCDALLGSDNSAVLLEEFERLQLFIQPLDGKHRWFRYHTMYREFLRAQLRKRAPELSASLHRQASRWFAGQELPAEALHHAFATEDREWCVHLVARCVPVWLRTGEFGEVLQWTSRLTVDEILVCTAVRDAHLMSLIFSRQFDRARADLQAAERVTPDAKAARTLPALQLMLAIMTDAGVQVTMQQIERLSIADDPYLSANLLNVSAYQMLVNKKFDAARRLALRGRELLQGTQHVYAAAQSAIVLILVDRAEGHAREAAEGCMQLYTRMREGRRTPIWVTATTAAASVHYHHNRLQLAETLCSEVLPLLSLAPSMENLTVAHVVAARLKCASARYGDALRLLDYLHSVLESSHCQRLLARVCFEKVRIWLLQDQPLKALAVLADCGQSFQLDDLCCPTGEADGPWEEFALSRVAILIHRGSFDAAAGLLQKLCERAEVAGDVYGQVRLEAALATCRWQARDEAAAFHWVNHALALTDNRGFSRAVFDDVFGLPKVFATAIRLSRVSTLPPAEYFKKFHDVLACDPYEEGPASAVTFHPLLTQRELDLLKLVSMGLSNRDISERSNITLLTTKWHLKNVFAKLGVSTRMEAVFRAQELQLVDGRPPFLSAR